jgi:hypothetical protein
VPAIKGYQYLKYSKIHRAEGFISIEQPKDKFLACESGDLALMSV